MTFFFLLCVCIAAAVTSASEQKLSDNISMVPVYLTYSDGVRDMAENCVSSLIASGHNAGAIHPIKLEDSSKTEGHYKTEAYYAFLRLKLKTFRGIVENNMNRWVMLVDSDVQFLRGWHHAILDRYVSSKAPSPPSIKLVAQREGASINTGVVLVYGSEETAALYREAWNAFGAKQRNVKDNVDQFLLGDQTAIVQLLTRVPRFRSMYHRFPRKFVNAATIDAQRQTVFVHHAHMSGKFKRYNLGKMIKYAAAHRSHNQSLHPPCLLLRHCSGSEMFVARTWKVFEHNTTSHAGGSNHHLPLVSTVAAAPSVVPPPIIYDALHSKRPQEDVHLVHIVHSPPAPSSGEIEDLQCLQIVGVLCLCSAVIGVVLKRRLFRR